MHFIPFVHRYLPRICRLRILLLLLVLLPPLSAEQPAKPGDAVTGVQATDLLKQIEQNRNQLLEERRQALQKAAKAATDADRAKILHDLLASQNERLAQLRQDTAKVAEAQKQAQEAKRPTKSPKG